MLVGADKISTPRFPRSIPSTAGAGSPSINPYLQGFSVLKNHLTQMQECAQSEYSWLNQRAAVAEETEVQLAELQKVMPGTPLPFTVAQFLKSHFADQPPMMEGDTPFPEKKWPPNEDTSFSAAELQAIQSALKNFSLHQVEFIADTQLGLQRIMQNYNTAVTSYSALQTLWAEQFKALIQVIR